MNDAGETSDLSRRVHNMVTAYVIRKSKAKSGIEWAEFKDKKIRDPETGKERLDVPQKYREAREKVCADAFLRLRSCKSKEDFVSYFAGTICSVPQFLPAAEYEKLALALLDEERWQEAKALAMLALSALSQI